MKNKSSWNSVKKLIEYPESGVLSKVIFKTKEIEATLFCMSNGTHISEHTASRAGVVFVLEGKGRFILKGELIPMLPGTIIYLKKRAVHSLKAEKNTSFLLLLSNK